MFKRQFCSFASSLSFSLSLPLLFFFLFPLPLPGLGPDQLGPVPSSFQSNTILLDSYVLGACAACRWQIAPNLRSRYRRILRDILSVASHGRATFPFCASFNRNRVCRLERWLVLLLLGEMFDGSNNYCRGYAGSINRLIDGQIVIHAGWRQPL